MAKYLLILFVLFSCKPNEKIHHDKNGNYIKQYGTKVYGRKNNSKTVLDTFLPVLDTPKFIRINLDKWPELE